MNEIKKIIWSYMTPLMKSIYTLKYIPKVNSPKTFNEKILNRMKYDGNTLFSKCSDKVKVREYVQDKYSKDILIPILGVYDAVTYDLLIKLPKPFVVKANHNSGPIFIIRNDRDVNDKIVTSLNDQLLDDYSTTNGEKWYGEIKPKILVEKMLSDNGKVPSDYKFHVFNQENNVEPIIILQVDYDRFENHSRTFYNLDGSIMPFSLLKPNHNKEFIKPTNFEKMVVIAKSLSQDFNYVRVDLYNVSGSIYFGELTFAHGAGQEKFIPSEYDLKLGQLWLNN